MRAAVQRRLLLAGLLLLGGARGEPLGVFNARIWQGGDTYSLGAIEIEAGRIAAIRSGLSEEWDGARMDAGGRFVVPGLIDTHVHLLAGGGDPPDSQESLEALLDAGVASRLKSFLAAGVTTVSSSGDFWPEIRELARSVGAGQLQGPRILYMGPFFSIPGGHPDATMCTDRRRVDPWCRGKLLVDLSNPGQVETALADLVGAVGIKLVYDDLGAVRIRHVDVASASDLVQRAARRGLSVHAHVYDPREGLELIGLGVRRFVHVPGSADREANRALFAAMRDQDVMAASTLSMLDFAVERTGALTSRRRLIGARFLAPLLAREGLLAFGTDVPWVAPAGAVRREIGLLRQAGLSPLEVLQSATQHAASYLGRETELGRIAPGYVADLLVLQSDPLEGERGLLDPLVVVKSGRIVVDRR